MKQPIVTIVTPSYNQGRFIRATIESVLSQDYPNIEYIIMDGGSTDGTAAIAREYSNRLTFISEKDRGQSHAINKGFRMARGEVVSWLNSDDVILPGAVARAVREFERTPTLGAVYGEGYFIDYAGKIKSRFPYTQPFNLWKLVYVSDYILQQTVYFRRSVFDAIGFLNENLHWGMDWDILMRIGKCFWIEYIPQYMGCLREYQEAKTFSGGHKRFRELVAIMRARGHLRYPPGYFSYGLDTYQAIICRYLPFGWLRRAVSSFAVQCYSPITEHCQGIYADGWAGTRTKYMLPAGRGKISITGTLPDMAPLRAQCLEIVCNGLIVSRRELSFGEFQIEFDWDGVDRQPVYIEIKASKGFVPSRAGLSADNRKLAYRLTKIDRSDSPQSAHQSFVEGGDAPNLAGRQAAPVGNCERVERNFIAASWAQPRPRAG
jgi:glycosyltransferase involved in cell wall biosynthesis